MNQELLEQIRLLESMEFDPIRERIGNRLNVKVRALVKGAEDDERNRGWIESLEWMLRLSSDIRGELEDERRAHPEDETEEEGAE